MSKAADRSSLLANAERHKVTIMLEECGLPYRIVPVNIGKGISSTGVPGNQPQYRMRRSSIGRPRRQPISVFESAPSCSISGRQDGKFYRRRGARVEVRAVAVLADGRARADGAGRRTFGRNYAPEQIKYGIDANQ